LSILVNGKCQEGVNFEDLIVVTAKHIKISVEEMVERLRECDATLMSALLSKPIGVTLYGLLPKA